MTEIIELFREMTRRKASDLHLNVTSPPQIRIRGELHSIPGEEPLTKYTIREMLYSIMTPEQSERLESYLEVDFSYAVPGLARWRVNAYFQRGALGAAFRIIPEKIRPFEELNVPDSILDLCHLPRGIVLVTGPTGSGKSTTLASMIDVINQTRSEHILTVEDPIEFVHTNKNCMVNQREVGADTGGFANALKSALRQDPDVILVGELRDLETIQIALTAAETGHLVFGTLHTSSAAKTIDRVIDAFPEGAQAQIRTQLASSLMGVITQTLVPTKDGEGRVVACEVMIPNSAIRNLVREGKIFQIPSIMQTSSAEGMQTLDAALASLVHDDVITMEEALKRCTEESEFQRMVASGAGAAPVGQKDYDRPTLLRLSQETLDKIGTEEEFKYDEEPNIFANGDGGENGAEATSEPRTGGFTTGFEQYEQQAQEQTAYERNGFANSAPQENPYATEPIVVGEDGMLVSQPAANADSAAMQSWGDPQQNDAMMAPVVDPTAQPPGHPPGTGYPPAAEMQPGPPPGPGGYAQPPAAEFSPQVPGGYPPVPGQPAYDPNAYAQTPSYPQAPPAVQVPGQPPLAAPVPGQAYPPPPPGQAAPPPPAPAYPPPPGPPGAPPAGYQ